MYKEATATLPKPDNKYIMQRRGCVWRAGADGDTMYIMLRKSLRLKSRITAQMHSDIMYMAARNFSRTRPRDGLYDNLPQGQIERPRTYVYCVWCVWKLNLTGRLHKCLRSRVDFNGVTHYTQVLLQFRLSYQFLYEFERAPCYENHPNQFNLCPLVFLIFWKINLICAHWFWSIFYFFITI